MTRTPPKPVPPMTVEHAAPRPRPPRPARRPELARTGLVTIVVPAKNEAAAIGQTLRTLPLATLRTMGFEAQVVVLDGNSSDGTPRIARAWGATVVTDREPGKGAAMRNGRRHFAGDFVVMLDADGTYAPDAIPRALAPLAWGEADVVMGRRIVTPGAMPRINRLGNRLLSLAARTLYVRRCPDLCTGLWAFRADALRQLPLRSRGFGLEAELFALSSRRGLRIGHVAVDYLPRRGQPNLSFGRDGMRIARRLLRTRFVPLGVPDAAAPAAAAERLDGVSGATAPAFAAAAAGEGVPSPDVGA